MSYGMRTNWPLGSWQAKLAKMYENVNQKRKPLETFARVTEMATGISRGVREEDRSILTKFVPRFLAWLLGLSTQLDVNLEEAVYNSYPGVCTHCRKPNGCACIITREKKPRLAAPEEVKIYQSKYPKPGNLPEWVAMFGGIYKEVNKTAGTMGMLSHFLEELGEVCEIIRFYLASDKDLQTWGVPLTRETIELQLKQELADLFAWYCGLVYAMGVEIDAEMKEIYQALCPECLKPICECSPYRVHTHLRLGARV